MNKKAKNTVVALLCGLWIFGLSIWGIIQPDGETSVSERRKLAQMPKISGEALLSGSFMSSFETYSADQFPLRDGFRRLKSVGEYYIFRRKDSNGIYLKDGFASKLEYPLNEDSIETAAKRFDYIYETYLKDSGGKVYLSVIPDKNYFMAESGGYPSLDYGRAVELLKEKADFAEYIDIFPTLELEDYYKTDTHWRQEKIVDAAKTLAEGMGTKLSARYVAIDSGADFYGVYYGQSALPLSSESLYYLESDFLAGVSVYDYESDSTGGVYSLEKLEGSDPYEVFLNGPRSLMVLNNPNATTKKELIIFRDSFGSSVAPLLSEAYSKITLIDIRYLPSPNLKFFVDFDGADTLFLYSTLILNNAETLK